MPSIADQPTDIQSPVTRFLAAPRPRHPIRGKQVLHGAIVTGVVLLDVGLAAWAFMSLRIAWILLHMHG